MIAILQMLLIDIIRYRHRKNNPTDSAAEAGTPAGGEPTAVETPENAGISDSSLTGEEPVKPVKKEKQEHLEGN